MKALVAYMSQTGNTKKVAEAIFGEIADEKEIKPIEEVASIQGYDIAFLGFPIHREGPDKKTVQLLKKHCSGGNKVALFITHASPEDGEELQGWLEQFKQAASGANIVDMFDCQGQLANGIKRIMSVLPQARYRRWVKLDNSQGQPDPARLDRARAFSRGVMAMLHEAQTREQAAGGTAGT